MGLATVRPLVQAKHFYRGRRSPIRLWVVHDMEAPERSSTAEAVANYFKRGTVKASAHYNIDNDSIVPSVAVGDTAFHAPGANTDGIGVEHAGYARQIRAEWLDPFGNAMLDLSAKLFVDVAVPLGIPPVKLSIEQVRDGKTKGICGHWDVSKAFGRSSHWDPGHEFPYDVYISRIRALMDDPKSAAAIPAPVVANRVLRRPMNGPEVRAYQENLNFATGAGLVVDGDFGPKTETATMNFQRFFDLVVDGIVGPNTRGVLSYVVALKKSGANKPKPAPVVAPPKPVSPAVPKWSGRYMKKGMVGNDIRLAQQRLQDRGWKITVDGDFGPATDSVVRAFQSEKRLTTDGIIGPDTWRTLWTAPVT